MNKNTDAAVFLIKHFNLMPDELPVASKTRVMELVLKYNHYNCDIVEAINKPPFSLDPSQPCPPCNGPPTLWDALCAGSQLPFCYSSVKEIIKQDVIDIITLIPSSLKFNYGEMRCRSYATPFVIAIANESCSMNIIHEIAKQAQKLSIDFNQSLCVNNKWITPVEELEKMNKEREARNTYTAIPHKIQDLQQRSNKQFVKRLEFPGADSSVVFQVTATNEEEAKPKLQQLFKTLKTYDEQFSNHSVVEVTDVNLSSCKCEHICYGCQKI